MSTEAQKRASKKYAQSMTTTVALKLNRKTDADIIRYLEGVDNKAGYLKELIRSDMSKTYWYGMRLRGFSPMCQPKDGFLEHHDSYDARYYDIIVYDRKLSEQECSDYALDYLGDLGRSEL